MARKLLTGQKHDKLLIMSEFERRDRGNYNKESIYKCLCDCGNHILRPSSYFRRKNIVKSCGCLNYLDLKNKRFGQLLAIKRIGMDYRGSSIWLCKCDCGNQKEITAGQLQSGSSSSCGCKMYNTKSQSFAWKGHGEISKSFFNSIRENAKTRKLKFDITIEFIWELFLQQGRKCKLTGLDLIFATKSNTFDRTASLDRIDSSKGYIEGNVQWVHKDVNYMKQEYIQKDFINMCKLVACYNS